MVDHGGQLNEFSIAEEVGNVFLPEMTFESHLLNVNVCSIR
jgi:hypothetical protein